MLESGFVYDDSTNMFVKSSRPSFVDAALNASVDKQSVDINKTSLDDAGREILDIETIFSETEMDEILRHVSPKDNSLLSFIADLNVSDLDIDDVLSQEDLLKSEAGGEQCKQSETETVHTAELTQPKGGNLSVNTTNEGGFRISMDSKSPAAFVSDTDQYSGHGIDVRAAHPRHRSPSLVDSSHTVPQTHANSLSCSITQESGNCKSENSSQQRASAARVSPALSDSASLVGTARCSGCTLTDGHCVHERQQTDLADSSCEQTTCNKINALCDARSQNETSKQSCRETLSVCSPPPFIDCAGRPHEIPTITINSAPYTPMTSPRACLPKTSPRQRGASQNDVTSDNGSIASDSSLYIQASDKTWVRSDALKTLCDVKISAESISSLKEKFKRIRCSPKPQVIYCTMLTLCNMVVRYLYLL